MVRLYYLAFADQVAIIHGQHRHEEIEIAKSMASMLKKYIAEQSTPYKPFQCDISLIMVLAELVEKLNKELDMFRATFNRRVVYFASLQEISDSVISFRHVFLSRFLTPK